MKQQRTHCVECGLAFGLVERSADFQTTCDECVGRFSGPLAVCRHCGRAIEIKSEEHLHFHAARANYCKACIVELRQLELEELEQEQAAVVANWWVNRRPRAGAGRQKDG